jgi:flagellar biosynthesis regulator FlbT
MAQGSAFSGFQVFVDHLITTDMEIAHVLRHRRKALRLVDVDGSFLWEIAYRLHHMVTPAKQFHQFATLLLAQQMGIHQRIAEFRQLIRLRLGLAEGNTRNINARKFGLKLVVDGRVEDGALD